MIDLARIRSTDIVLDIGAGTGALTFPLAEKAAQVLAIETDPVFIDKLFSKIKDGGNIRIKPSDFLEVPLPKSPFAVVANIPYSITTAIMAKPLDHPVPLPSRAARRRGAKRFTAVPVQDPRILSWRMHYDMRLVRTVSPQHFAPPPKVDSAILAINRRKSRSLPRKDQPKFRALATMDCGTRGRRYSRLWRACSRLLRLRSWSECWGGSGAPHREAERRAVGTVFHTMLQHVLSNRWPKLSASSKGKFKKRITFHGDIVVSNTIIYKIFAEFA